MPTTPEFQKAYKGLNKAQKEAVDAIYGPVMVVAGPGTGKTQILAVRIANILQESTGTKPEEILALTFTESAASEMRTRLSKIIGSAAYRVRIDTFHGFARSILERRPDIFPRISDGQPIGEVRGVALMEQLLDKRPYTKIRSAKNPYRVASKLLSFMGELKKENYSPESYKAELSVTLSDVMNDPDRIHLKGKYEGKEKGEFQKKRTKLEKHLEVADLFADYEEALEKEQLYDFEDLIREAVRGMEADDGFKAEIQEQTQFMLADEHQDANPIQNKLLELLSDFGDEPNLFLVGDEKQAIYRFQGASLKSFFYFQEKYPNIKVILLTENYRSTNEILKSAHDLIAPAPIPDPKLRAELKSVAGKGVRVLVAKEQTPRGEHEAILAYIEKRVLDGNAYEDIAILTRKNADVLALSALLRTHAIPEDHATADLSALAHPAGSLFVQLVRAGVNPQNTSALARALFAPGVQASHSEILKTLALPRERDGALAQVIAESGTLEMKGWLAVLEKASREAPATHLIEWLTNLASDTGYLKGLLALSANEDAYEAYQGMLEEAMLVVKAKPNATAMDFIRHLDLIEAHELPVKRARTKRNGVQVMTAHKAKGMEFPYVIVAHVTENSWMSTRGSEFSLMIEKEEDEHDIRRLLYVALTRARKEVLFTYSEESAEGRSQSPLRFLADIAEHLDTYEYEKVKPKGKTAKPRAVLDPEFLKERILSQGLASTSYNNFCENPWKYLFNNLLRIPDQQTLPLMFGNAVHAGFEAYARAHKKGEATPEIAIAEAKRQLYGMPMTDTDREALLLKAKDIFSTYFDQYSSAFEKLEQYEFPVKVPLLVPNVGEIILSGKLDRVDSDERGGVTVVDYKTGEAKSENQIRGLTEDSDGNYYRQLVFYKLLLSKDGRYQMNTGSLQFVQPDDSGKIVIRNFEIPDSEVAQLEKDIIKAVQAIADGSAFATLDLADADFAYADIASMLMQERASK